MRGKQISLLISRAGIVFLGFLFFLVPIAEVTAYSYSGYKRSTNSVVVDVGDPSFPSGWISSLANAMSSWNAAASPFYFMSGSSGNKVTTAAKGIGKPLAETTNTYSGNTIVDTNLVFNTSYSWSTSGESGKYDVENTAAHEFGHWLRLLDLYQYSDTEKTMYYDIGVGEVKKRTLESDDVAGINYIYP